MSEESKPAVAPSSGDTLTIKLVPQSGDEPLSIKAKKTTKLVRLRDAFCKEKAIDANVVRFFTESGERLEWDKSLEEAGIKDDDSIQVTLQQVGGLLQ